MSPESFVSGVVVASGVLLSSGDVASDAGGVVAFGVAGFFFTGFFFTAVVFAAAVVPALALAAFTGDGGGKGSGAKGSGQRSTFGSQPAVAPFGTASGAAAVATPGFGAPGMAGWAPVTGCSVIGGLAVIASGGAG